LKNQQEINKNFYFKTISFRRKVVSPDKSTDLSLAQCAHFLFPVQGGRVMAHSSRDFQQVI